MAGDGLTIADSTVAWMQSRGIPARPDDLERTYAFPHPLNLRQRGRKVGPPHPRRPRVDWQVELFAAGDEPLLDGWLAREVDTSFPLQSAPGDLATVALNRRCVVRIPYRRQGLAAAIYAAEEELYRSWGVREIHIPDAQDLGPMVWVQEPFGFTFLDADAVAAEWRAWAPRNGFAPEPVPPPHQLPHRFLARYTDRTLRLFKVLS